MPVDYAHSFLSLNTVPKKDKRHIASVVLPVPDRSKMARVSPAYPPASII